MKTYPISNMTCEGCTRSLQRAVEKVLGPGTATVRLQPGELDVHCDHDPALIQDVVERAGFALTPPKPEAGS